MARWTAGIRRTDFRHKAALPSPSRRSTVDPGSWAMFRRDATRNCHSTRSWPVIASVTGCSTCSRVFISMNQIRSARSPSDASAMNSMVPAPTYSTAFAAFTAAAVSAARGGCRSCPARGLPRSPSDDGAAWSSRVRTDARYCRGGRRISAPRYGAGWQTYFSISTRSSPKNDAASRRQDASDSANVSALVDAAHALAAAARPPP